MGTILCRMSFYSGDDAEKIILFLNTEQIDWFDSIMAHLLSTCGIGRFSGVKVHWCPSRSGHVWMVTSGR